MLGCCSTLGSDLGPLDVSCGGGAELVDADDDEVVGDCNWVVLKAGDGSHRTLRASFGRA